MEGEYKHRVRQHKLIYSIEIDKLILINCPKILFADKTTEPHFDGLMLERI